MKTKVSEKGQITIPKEIRDQYGIHAGTELQFDAEGEKITIYKVIVRDAIDAWRGKGRGARKVSTNDLLKSMRG
jgi:AbrB family looped-hinge helix DNA binding protein